MKRLEAELESQANALQVTVSDEMSARLRVALDSKPPRAESSLRARTVFLLRPMPLAAAAALIAVLLVAGVFRNAQSVGAENHLASLKQSTQNAQGQTGQDLMEKVMGAANAEDALRQEWLHLKSDILRMGTMVREEFSLSPKPNVVDAV